MITFIRETTFTVITCCSCGMQFGVPKPIYQRLHRSGESFWCPNGHSQRFSHREELEDEVEFLREQLIASYDRTQRAKDDAERQRRSANAYKGHLTKTKRRIANGVCPCCNRSFQNLRSHMETTHPEYQDGGGA